ncbi:MAG: hypothetical protein ABSD46_07030 [Bacteroidota bacterium]
MIEKIKGQFLKIEKDGEYYKVEYVRENGEIYWVKMDTDNISELARGGEAEFERLKLELLGTKDEKKVDEIKSRMLFFQVQALWPQMYIAFCKGEDLGRFFESTQSSTTEILHQQIEIFQEQYDISKFEECNEQGKDQFILDLKHWIYKFETAEKLKTKHLSLKNSLIQFTNSEIFQYQAQLETIKILLPFLRSQLALTQSMQLPKLRKEAILPLGNLTAREILLRTAEQLPEIAQLSREEQFKYLNQSIQKVGEVVNKVTPTTWAMDSTTHNSLRLQQWKENVEKHGKLIALREKLLKDIEDSPVDLPHGERVKFQRQSVEVNLRIAEFEKWIKENGMELHIEPDKSVESKNQESQGVTEKSSLTTKIILLEKCKKECEKRNLPIKETITREIKYEIAKTIGINVPAFKSFKSKNPKYHLVSKMLSELGYSRKGSTKFSQ